MGTREYQSHSSLTTYTTCPKKYYNTYIVGKIPVGTSVDLEYGSAFSALLETGERARLDSADLSELNKAIVWELYLGYTKMYPDEFGPNTTVRREIPFEYEKFRGRFDAIDEHRGVLIETKTTRRLIDWNYWSDKGFNQQAMLYQYCASKLGYNVSNGLLYDVIRRPMIRQRTGEKTNAFLERVQTWIFENRHDVYVRRPLGPWSQDELEQNYSNCSEIANQIAGSTTYFENRGACYAYGTLCGYYDSCFRGESLDNPEHYIDKHERT